MLFRKKLCQNVTSVVACFVTRANAMSEKADADLPFPMSVLTSDFQPAGIPFSGRVVIRVKGWRDVKQFPSIDWVFHREVKRPDLIL
jgi:hypothetical protein